jgi:uncharacterized delta-60 repeat protein
MALVAATTACALAHAAKPGHFDRSFGDEGKTKYGPGCLHGAHFTSVAIDSHNRIVTAGSGCFARTRQSGRLDNTFDYANGRSEESLAFDGGRIVTAGYYGQHEGFAVARNKPNGSWDTSFADCIGTIDPTCFVPTTDFGDPKAGALSVAVDSDRRPVAAGFTRSGGGDADFALARFKWNGALDPSFGSGGRVRTDFGTDGDYANSVAIDPRGRIVVGGGRSRFELARYRPDGTLDPSFGDGGKVTTDFGPHSSLKSIAIDHRDRIVAGGAAANHDFALARYNPNGRLDRSFSNNGKVTGPLRDNAGAGFVGIDSRRRIVAVGGGGVRSYRLARYKPNGSLDRSFGRHGKVKIEGNHPSVWSAAIDSRDRIVVAGSNSGLNLARFIGYRRP